MREGWEGRERGYLVLKVERLNDATRSYNIIAPELAKKAYLSLERELERCYREGEKVLEEEVRKRAEEPEKVAEVGGGWGMEKSVFYEREEPKYGLKELWRDWFGKGNKT